MVTYNIALVGDHGVGKTSFITRFETGDFNHDTKSIELKDKTTVRSRSSNNKYKIVVKDKIPDDYDAVIIMFDLTSIESYNSAMSMVETINLPTMLCGNKCDLTINREISDRRLSLEIPRRPKFRYYSVSAKSIYNIPTVVDMLGIVIHE